MTPLFDDGRVTLYNADALSIDLPQADLIVTDCPYGVTSLQWDQWPQNWLAIAADVANSMWLFGSMRMLFDHADEFRAAGWKMSQDLVWVKHNGANFHADRFRRVHEHIVHFYRGKWESIYAKPQYTNDARKRRVKTKSRPPQLGDIDRTPYQSIEGGPRLQTSIIQADSMHGKAIHPTEKPIETILPLIRYGCPPGGLVLDPFAGSGSTLQAARIAGRRAIGYEINEIYAQKAAQRLAQEELFAQPAG